MKCTFFGTRGSTPVSGKEFVRYGGNTTCIALEAGGQLLLVDCGTGLQPLRGALFGNGGAYAGAHILMTHWHWDHINGIAFFSPFFTPGYQFDWYSERRGGMGLSDQIGLMMDSPLFPVKMDAFHAQMRYHDLVCGQCLTVGGFSVATTRLNHPDICTGYRLEYGGKSVCIVGDYEHGEDGPIIEFARCCDLLVYDAQYSDAEYPSKTGWGHSTLTKGCEIAAACGAKRVALTHHDPMREDVQLDQFQAQARALFAGAVVAWDGLWLEL